MRAHLDRSLRRPVLRVLTAALAIAMGASSGCGAGSASKTAAQRVTPAAPIKDVGAKPTDAEVEQAANELIESIESGDVNKFNSIVDWSAVFAQATGGIDVPAEWKSGFERGFLKGLDKPGGLFERMNAMEKSGGTITLLRVHEVDGRPRALVRAIDSDQGVDYLDFEMARRPSGKVRAIDVYVFISGERLTKMIRGFYLPLAANQSRSVVEKLLKSESDMVKAVSKLKSLADAVREEKPQEALAIYNALPPGAKKEKSVMLLRLQAAQAMNDDSVYLAAMDDLAKTFPNDPCVELTSVDSFVIRKDYVKALAAIDRLENSVGGDPYLSVIRARILVEEGKPDDAAKMAQKAVEAEPSLPDTHFCRLQVANGQKKYADMVKYLREYKDMFDDALEEIDSEPEFAGFAGSSEYKEYRAKSSKK
jgi:hypothetical protein